MASKKSDGIVTIGNKEYLTVAKRVNDFRQNEKFADYAIITSCKLMDDVKVVVLCEIKNGSGTIVATGHSEEFRAASKINRTSALENAETSAIGRALACLGMGGTEFASANEVESAIQQQETLATPAQAAEIATFIAQGIISAEQLQASFGQAVPALLMASEAERVIHAVHAAQQQTGSN